MDRSVVGLIREREQGLKDEIKKMDILSSLARKTAYITDIHELFQQIMHSVHRMMDYDIYMSIILEGKRKGYLLINTTSAVSQRCIKEVQSKLLEVTNYLTGENIGSEDLRIDFQGSKKREGASNLQVKTSYNIPIIVEHRPIGIINVSSFKKNAFGETNIKTLYTIADQTSVAIQGLRKTITREKREIESIIKSLGDGVIVVSPDEKVIFINPAAKSMLKVKDDSSPFLEEMKRGILKDLLRKRKGIKRREIGVRNEILEVKTTPLEVGNGKSQGAVAILRDITKAKEVDRMKSEFVSSVSHELRTPLTTMKEFVSILLDGIGGSLSNEQEEYLHIVKSNIARLARIVSDLLDISRLESGRIELNLEPINIALLTRQVATSLQPNIESAKLSLEIELPPDFPSAYADADRVSQVLINLITNAERHTPQGGKITISGKNLGKGLQLNVSDTGEGIPEDRQEEIFDRFRQLHRTPGPGAKGTGLGLAIVKEIISLHKGKIWVESEPGKGSSFHFTLPKLKAGFGLKRYIDEEIRFSKRKHRDFSIVLIEVKNFNGQAPSKKSLMGVEDAIKGILRSPRDAIFTKDKERTIFIGLPDTKKQSGLMFVKRIEGTLSDKAANFRTTVKTYPEDAEEIDKFAN